MRSRAAQPLPPSGGPRHDWRAIRRLLPYLWPIGEPGLRARVVASLMLLVAAKLFTVAVPFFYKAVVDALTIPAAGAPPGGSEPTAVLVAVPIGLLVGYGVVRLLQQASGEVQDLLFAKVTERAVRAVGLNTFTHLHRLSLRFHLDRQTGGLARVIERGTRGIEVLLRLVLFRAGPSLLELVFVCAILWRLFDWTFAAATLATIGGYSAFTMAVTEWRQRFRRVMNAADADAGTKAIDSLLNHETVKSFGNEGFETARYDRALAAYEDASLRSRSTLALLNLGQGAIVAVGLVVVMLLAADGVVAGRMTIGDFVMVNSYLLQLALPLNFLGVVYREIKQALTDMEALFALQDTVPEVADAPDATALLLAGGGAVRFEAVSFAYGPDRPILHDVSFTVPAGRTLALVGASGAGKSTIARLLLRFYDVTAGRVLIDGQDVRTLTQDSLRAAIGVVPQDTVLFNDSIYYNIAYGRPSATRAEVEQAARLAAIHDFIAGLPQGYDTVVGERGLKLSGGEKQRVAIARTILKRPAILVFDEATSALDSATERDIQAALVEVARARTTLIIAHRLSTVVAADEILVLDAGRVVERGTHAALLAADGAYAAMWRRQRHAAELEAALAAARDPAPAVVG